MLDDVGSNMLDPFDQALISLKTIPAQMMMNSMWIFYHSL